MTQAITAVRDFTRGGETGAAGLRLSPQQLAHAAELGDTAPPETFAAMVKEFATDVNAMQFQAGHAIDQFVTGEAADVHQVMVAVREAGIAMDLMLEIRNRVLEGYQELIRMQV